MIIETKATLKGRVKWEILEDGVVVEGGHWNDNLITNSGLHQFGQSSPSSAIGTSGYPVFSEWRRYCAVGLGTTPPTFGDAVMENEVQRTTTTGGFSHSTTTGFDDGGTTGDSSDDTIFITSTMVRHFEFSSPVELGEYGYFPSSSGGQVSIRELFRDPYGDPIILSLQGGRQLRIEHELTVRVPFRADASSFILQEYDAEDTLTLETNYDIGKTFYALNTSGSNIQNVITSIFAPTASAYLYQLTSNPPQEAPTASPGSGTMLGGFSVQPYDHGTPYQRRKTIVVDTASGNREFYGFAVSGHTNQSALGQYGHKTVFREPTSFQKFDTHLLEVDYVVSWSRA